MSLPSNQALVVIRATKIRTNVRAAGLECADCVLKCLFFSVTDILLPSAAVSTSAVGVEVRVHCVGELDQGPGLEPQGDANLNDAHQARCLPCSLM